ncbi:hypothetical protein JW906_16090 [bacterium]|nr:hypothetical protein [bacterium]
MIRIIRLTAENLETYAYPCMSHPTERIENPSFFRFQCLPTLRKWINQRIFGFAAVFMDRSIGSVFYAPLAGSSLPLKCDAADVQVLICSYIDQAFRRADVGRRLIDAVLEDCASRSGLLVMSSCLKSYMYYKPFLRMGFKLVLDGEFWKIGYRPIRKAEVKVEMAHPRLHWKDLKPFTWITENFCPLLVYMTGRQKQVIQKISGQESEVIPLEKAVERDRDVTPGFYLYGEKTQDILSENKFKKMIKKALRKKSAGNA